MNVEGSPLVPSFVVFQSGHRRMAFPRETVRELIASPVLYSFPQTTPSVAGVVLRRGRILPVLNLGPGLGGGLVDHARFFLVVERKFPGSPERCAIPIQGACELVSGIMIPAGEQSGVALGYLDLSGEQIEVLDLEKAISAGAKELHTPSPMAEALS